MKHSDVLTKMSGNCIMYYPNVAGCIITLWCYRINLNTLLPLPIIFPSDACREHFYGFCDTEAMSSDNLSDLSRSSSNDNCSSASLSSGLDGSESGDIEAGVGEYDGEDSCEEGAACSSDHEEGEQPLLPLSSHNNNQISVPIDARPTSSNQMHNAAGLVRRAVN